VLGDDGARIPTREVPDWVVRTVGRFVPALGTFADLLGPPKAVSAEKATKVLGWQPRSAAVTVAETGKSLQALVPDPSGPNMNPRAMVLGCPGGDRSSRQVITLSSRVSRRTSKYEVEK
jgi:hypothetical protein